MSKKKKNYDSVGYENYNYDSIGNEDFVESSNSDEYNADYNFNESAGDKYSFENIDKMINADTADTAIDNDIKVYTETIDNADVSNTDYIEVVVPVLTKIGKDKVVVDYQGYGITVNVDDVNAKTVTLRVNGEIGTPDFTYEVI